MKTINNFLLIISLLTTVAFTTPIKELNSSTESNSSSSITFEDETKTSLKKIFSKKNRLQLKNIRHKKFLKKFYKNSDYQVQWLNQKGLQKNRYKELIYNINSDLTLDNQSHIVQQTQQIQKELENNLTKDDLYKIEISLSSLYYDFLKHKLYGEIDWKAFARRVRSLKKYKINAAWVKEKAPYKISTLLAQPNINKTIEDITPKHFGYKALNESLKKLYKIKADGGWKKMGYFKRLELGSTGEMVLQLHERLIYSGDYKECNKTKVNSTNNNDTNQSQKSKIDKKAIFDECLNMAVKRFQKRHGLVADGIVGKGTRKALNITVDEKIKTVLLNIDRIKWLPRAENERYLIVNIPEFMLYYLEDEKVKQSLKVIVGAKRHPTPIFNEKISYIVLNPYWKVPESIIRKEIVPAMIKNPNYLKKHGFEVHRTWFENSKKINVSELYWEDYLEGGVRFPYRIMQPPGPRNALGKIKFKFPNRFAVYLHDTPTRHLFKRTVRTFSHGCVRLSNPVKLLETIATFNKNINLAKASKTLKGKRKVEFNIANKLPIYLIYLTAGVNSNNELEFRNDIYNYDKYMKRIPR